MVDSNPDGTVYIYYGSSDTTAACGNQHGRETRLTITSIPAGRKADLCCVQQRIELIHKNKDIINAKICVF
jgi:hypothetical protein